MGDLLERPIVDRETPLATAEMIAKANSGNRRCFKAGKFWIEHPDEGDENRGSSGKLEWIEIEKDEIRAEIYAFLAGADVDDGNGVRDPFKPKKRDVDQVMDALKAYMFDSEGMMDGDK